MKHPWLLNRRKSDRQSGAPLESTVVQRIQVTSRSCCANFTVYSCASACERGERVCSSASPNFYRAH